MIAVVPKPVQIVPAAGVATLERGDGVYLDPSLPAAAAYLPGRLERQWGWRLREVAEPQAAKLRFVRRQHVGAGAGEAYELHATKTGILIEAPDTAGWLHGCETLLQVAQRVGDSPRGAAVAVPCGHIADQPRFAWRGLMLDVTRHFQPLPRIKRVLDLMASLKLNRLHLHLCDDEAWRLEIPQYPRLTDRAAGRNASSNGQAGGEYYTAEDIRELLAYAGERGVVVVPEIEMPAHANAALVAYPELGCDGPLPVAAEGGWDAFTRRAGRRAFCCGEPAVYRFLQDVLTHVARLFDAPLLHIGGDERPARAWTACPRCRHAMAELGLVTEAQMQAAFMERINTFVQEHLGRRTIAWADNLREGAPGDQIVHGWYPGQAAAAARLGHQTINSNHEWTYLDYPATVEAMKAKPDWMIVLPVEKVYHFDPTPDGLEPHLQTMILGSEAALWTEYVRSEAELFGQLMPRLAAFAEALWSPRGGRSYDDFAARLAAWESGTPREAPPPQPVVRLPRGAVDHLAGLSVLTTNQPSPA